MLDDLKSIHERDAQDALGVAGKQWQQLQYDYSGNIPELNSIENVVITGMGGSSLPAVFLKSWPGTLRPLEIVHDYTLPEWVNAKTLVIVSSYSGNTEETLSVLADAEAKGGQIVVTAAGGKLADLAGEKNLPLLTIPGGIQPRMSSFYFLAAFTQILENAKVVKEGSVAELAAVGDWLKDQTGSWQPEVATAQNPAKQLAQELMGRSVVIYAGPKLWPAANKWKICCNENAKNVAWTYQYPEFNHNEFIGWSSHPVEKPYAIVEIRSNLEHPRVKKRFEVSERLLSGMRPAPNVVVPQGETLLQQLLWSAAFGDFVTLYLALLNGVNPTPVDLVEKFKAELNK